MFFSGSHGSLACYYKVDVLLTWNCQHIANANKLVRRIRLIDKSLFVGCISDSVMHHYGNDRYKPILIKWMGFGV